MSWENWTVDDALKIANNFLQTHNQDILRWLYRADSSQLNAFIDRLDPEAKSDWARVAGGALVARLQNESAKQTEILIAESRNLTAQNKILVDESIRLGNLTKKIVNLTWGLLVFTAALFIRDLCKETHTTEVINNPVTVTNVPVYFCFTNPPAQIMPTKK